MGLAHRSSSWSWRRGGLVGPADGRRIAACSCAAGARLPADRPRPRHRQRQHDHPPRLLAVARWQDARGGVAIGLLSCSCRSRTSSRCSPTSRSAASRLHRRAADDRGRRRHRPRHLRVDPWLAFIDTLREPLERTFTANIGFSGLLRPGGVVIGVVVGVAVFVAGARMGGRARLRAEHHRGDPRWGRTRSSTTWWDAGRRRAHASDRPRWLVPFPWLLVAFPLIPLWLTGLAGVVRSSPPPPDEEAVPPAAAPG